MKASVLFLAMFATCAFGQFQGRMPAVPVSSPDADFPVHVHIVTVRWGGDTMHLYRSIQGEMRGGPGYYEPTGSAHGFGTANFLGDQGQGFYYAFDCTSSFQPNVQMQEFYQARWKHAGQSLEILMAPIGTDHGELCELRVALRPVLFDAAFAKSQLPGGTINGPIWTEPEISFIDPDSDYPLHLHIITGVRQLYNGGVKGYGTANLVADGGSLQGVDFNYNCSRGLIPNAQPDEVFQGHWVKKDQRMEILLQRIGSDKVDRCQLNVNVKGSPYPGLSTAQPGSASAAAQPVLSHP